MILYSFVALVQPHPDCSALVARPSMNLTPNELQVIAAEASGFLKQLASEQRLMILCHLTDGEKSVSELQSLVGLEQSSISQHLARLRKQGIITARRNSQSKLYSIADDNALKVIELLHAMYCEQEGTATDKTRAD